MSLCSTFSFGNKIEIIQNNIVAPVDLKQNNPKGEMIFVLAIFLHTVRFMPKIKYVPKTARCPVRFSLLIFKKK